MPSSDQNVTQGVQSFVTTQWTAVLAAGQDSSLEGQVALDQLCKTYWYPLYAYVRRKGHNHEDAQDLTQEFFNRFLERKYLQKADRNRGRFRTFLLTSLKNFLINEWTKANREKRGGGAKVLSLDQEVAEARFAAEPVTEQPPDALYDRGWADIVIRRARAAFRAEFEQAGKLKQFELLHVYVWGEELAQPASKAEGQDKPKSEHSYAKVAGELEMTEGALKTAVHRLRERYKDLVRAEVTSTVTTPVEADEEMRYLISIMREFSSVGNLGPEEL